MDDIKQRLQDTSANCLKAYEVWVGDKTGGKNRETLLDSIHELRKVASRLEIDMAVSERDENARKPIPIPSHRDSKPPKRGRKDDDNIGNVDPGENKEKPAPRKRPSGGGKKPAA